MCVEPLRPAWYLFLAGLRAMQERSSHFALIEQRSRSVRSFVVTSVLTTTGRDTLIGLSTPSGKRLSRTEEEARREPALHWRQVPHTASEQLCRLCDRQCALHKLRETTSVPPSSHCYGRRAAMGTGGRARRFPWGNETRDENRCCRSDGTCPVGTVLRRERPLTVR